MIAERSFWHRSVMPEETLRLIKCKPGGSYVDATLGGGGHAEQILKRTSPNGRLLGIDRDPEALNFARDKLSIFGNRVNLIQGSFSNLKKHMADSGWSCADGILLDLGVSSHQLDTPDRGFSFKNDGPLDMRMNPESGISVAQFLRQIDENELAHIIREFGEERFASKIARRIVERRNTAAIETTADLAKIVADAMGPSARRQRIHPATRTFQALRIYVNDELGQLSEFLKQAPTLLCKEGCLVIITYHSLEDRIVKRSFKEWNNSGVCRIVNKKVITPAAGELRENPRSRSAKLRALERI